MTASTAGPIGLLLVRIVKHSFEEVNSTASSGESGRPAIRLSGFSPDEISFAVSALAGWRLPGEENPIEIVVGSTELPGLEEFLLPGERTLTSYRNANECGLVVFEVDAQSDEQGLKQMHSVADSDVLGSASGADLTKRLRWLQLIGWEQATAGSGLDSPAALEQELDQLYAWLASTARPSLRRWTAFVTNCANRIAAQNRAVAADEVRGILASELGALGLFRDPLLYTRRASSERRITRNQSLSELRSPQGRDLREDDLSSRIDRAEFLDPTTSEPVDASVQEELRQQMRLVQTAGGPSAETNIDFIYWEQLFEKKSSASGVGELVREFLDQEHPQRGEEFADLQIEDGLDEGDPESAETLLTAEPPPDRPPLADILPKGLRKKIDRLVFRGEQSVADPLIAILNGLKALPPEDGTGKRTVTLDWERFDSRGAYSARLFGFLYGRTLLEVHEGASESLGSNFEVDSDLLATGAMREVFESIRREEEAEEEGDASEDAWAPLQLAVRTSDSRTPLIRFRWSPQELPGLVFFARLVVAGGARGRLSGPAIDEWAERTLHSWEPLQPIQPPTESGLTPRWADLAAEHLQSISANGLSAGALGDFVAEWETLLREARDTLVPNGAPLEALTRFVEYETAGTSGGNVVVLGTHPIRLRWLGNHLSHLAEFLARALEGGLNLNGENDQLYFDGSSEISGV